MNPPKFVPRLVFWELTKGCNLRCIHCRATAQEHATPLEQSTPDAQKVKQQVYSGYFTPIFKSCRYDRGFIFIP